MVNLVVLVVPLLFSLASGGLSPKRRDIEAEVGKRLDLGCATESRAAWTKNGQPVKAGNNVKLSKTTLTIFEVKESDAGVYKSPDGKREFRVTVVHRQKLKAKEGEKFCHSFVYKTEISRADWEVRKKDGVNLYADIELNAKKPKLSKGGYSAEVNKWKPHGKTTFCIEKVKVETHIEYVNIIEFSKDGKIVFSAARSFQLD